MPDCRNRSFPYLKRPTCPDMKARSSTAGRNISPAAATSHNMRPRPGRRRCPFTEPLTILLISFSAILLLSTLCTPAGATEIPAQFRRGPAFARLARRGEILIDVPILRRQGGDPFDTGTATSTKSSSSSSSSSRDVSTYSTTATPLPSTVTAPSSSSAFSTGTIMTAPTSTNVPLPRPFDTSLGSNFTSASCPNFFSSFLGNSTFTSCLPLSLLLQVSLDPSL